MTDAEIIRAVAEKVMGWNEGYASSEPKAPLQWLNNGGVTPFMVKRPWHGSKVFNPLANTNHTLMVIERMRELGWGVQVMHHFEHTSKWYAIFYHQVTAENDGRAKDESLGTAVCLAALKAMALMSQR